jgi:hypothetical protein
MSFSTERKKSVPRNGTDFRKPKIHGNDFGTKAIEKVL